MISQIVDCDGEKSSKVQRVDLANPGSGYTVAPAIAFHGGGGVGAAATAGIADGVIGIVSITSGGSGYSTVPTITIGDNASGVNTATAIAYINNLGYTVAPTVTISSPHMNNSGNYIFNEEVVGSSSSVVARVKSWNETTNILEVSITSGSFINGELITGRESGAVHEFRRLSQEFTKDEFAENLTIENEADSIIDFSQSNPFGMP